MVIGKFGANGFRPDGDSFQIRIEVAHALGSKELMSVRDQHVIKVRDLKHGPKRFHSNSGLANQIIEIEVVGEAILGKAAERAEEKSSPRGQESRLNIEDLGSEHKERMDIKRMLKQGIHGSTPNRDFGKAIRFRTEEEVGIH